MNVRAPVRPIQSCSHRGVTMVTDHFYPFRGGLEVHTEELAVALQATGCPVRVVTVQRPEGTQRREVRRGLSVHRVGGPGKGALRGAIAIAGTVLELWRTRREYGIVHSHTFGDATLAAWLASRLTRHPLVIEDHRGGPDGNLAALMRRPFGRALWRRYRADPRVVLLSISNEIASGLLAHGAAEDRVRHRWNGVDTTTYVPATDAERVEARAALGLPADVPLTIYLGRVAEVKGIDVLLDAWARVPAPAHLVVVGEGPLSGAMKERAVAVAPGRVTFTGRVPDTAPYLRAADIWVLPSFAEGLPISLLEAMACGLACVATAVGGVPDMVEDGSDGLLVMPGDPELLATALERLSSDLPEARRMGAAARRTAEARFAMGTVARTYAELYDEVPDVIASGAPS
ncbi:MAG: hypothetical protein QOH79_3278 [Acidimicrobiaceae bacterium]